MKDLWKHLSIRFPLTLLLGLLLLACHGHRLGPLSVLIPQTASPWELSKLSFWPLFFTLFLTGGLSGGGKQALTRALPCLLAAPLVMAVLLWSGSGLGVSGIWLAAWLVTVLPALLIASLLRPVRSSGVLWVLLLALMAVYAIFTWMPPAWGPFLAPGDVAAMATIPC